MRMQGLVGFGVQGLVEFRGAYMRRADVTKLRRSLEKRDESDGGGPAHAVLTLTIDITRVARPQMCAL